MPQRPPSSGFLTSNSGESGFVSHMKGVLVLSGPAIVSRAGIITMITVDTIMVALTGVRELAYFGLSIPVQFVLMMIGIGVLQGAMVLVAQAFGAGRTQDVGMIWRAAVLHALVFGVILGVAGTMGGVFLAAIGQDPEIVEGTARVLFHFGWGVPGMLLYLSCSYMLDGIQRPHVAMIAVVFANVLNFALNLVFVFGTGEGAFPAGAEGAVFATSIARWFLFFFVLIYIVVRLDAKRFGIVRSLSTSSWRAVLGMGRRMRAIGVPIAIAFFFETMALGSLTLLAGYLGEAALAAHQLALQFNQIGYMIAVGAAAGTGVKVGAAVGRDDVEAVRLAGLAGVVVILAVLTPYAAVLLFHSDWAAGLVLNDAAVRPLAASAIFAVGTLVVFYGVMTVVMGALRGAGDVWTPMTIVAGAFWLVSVPGAWFFAFEAQLGAPGLLYGMLMGVLVAKLWLSIRFGVVSGGRIRQA